MHKRHFILPTEHQVIYTHSESLKVSSIRDAFKDINRFILPLIVQLWIVHDAEMCKDQNIEAKNWMGPDVQLISNFEIMNLDDFLSLKTNSFDKTLLL